MLGGTKQVVVFATIALKALVNLILFAGLASPVLLFFTYGFCVEVANAFKLQRQNGKQLSGMYLLGYTFFFAPYCVLTAIFFHLLGFTNFIGSSLQNLDRALLVNSAFLKQQLNLSTVAFAVGGCVFLAGIYLQHKLYFALTRGSQ